MTIRMLLLAAMLLAPLIPAHAEDAWRCTNDIEVQCSPQACTAETEAGAFTPMAVAFDSSGSFAVCAYSGCLEGQGTVGAKTPFLIIWQAQVSRSGPHQDDREDVLIAFHPHDRIAVVKAGGLATPLRCSKNTSTRP